MPQFRYEETIRHGHVISKASVTPSPKLHKSSSSFTSAHITLPFDDDPLESDLCVLVLIHILLVFCIMPPSIRRTTTSPFRKASAPFSHTTCTSSPSHISSLIPPSSFHPSTQLAQRRHGSVPARQTRQREKMWTWLNGPGAVFQRPAQGSTNYLGAYDKHGQLIRLQGSGRSRTAENGEDQESNPLPEEEKEDLQPFPLNPFFRSQSILSERLKKEIYQRVVGDGQSIREVSQALGVEMRRVGAVIRLKTIENQWVQQVRPVFTASRQPHPTTFNDEVLHSSISLQDSSRPQIVPDMV